MVKTVHLVRPANEVQLVRLVPQALLVRKALRVPLAEQDRKGRKGQKVHLDLPE